MSGQKCFNCRWSANKKARKMPCRICKHGSRWQRPDVRPLSLDTLGGQQ